MNVNEVKDNVQREALKTHKEFNGFSTLAMCTGSGKSRCGVLRAQEVVEENPNAKILLGCFTTDQRDNVWRNEFNEWQASNVYINNVTDRVCYKSLNTISGKVFDLVLLDEAHHLTEACIPFFENNTIKSILCLTATPPTDKIKKAIIDTIAPISFVYPVEQGIKDGVVAPYEIDIIYTKLEDIQKTVVSGSKKKPFKQTELNYYTYWNGIYEEAVEKHREFVKDYLWPLGWSDSVKFQNKEKMKANSEILEKNLKKKAQLEAKYKFAMSKRTQLIYNSLNKTRIAKRLINEFCIDEERYLFFAGSIAQSNEILPNQTYNSKSTDEAYKKFLNCEINKLVAVKGLNEGSNIPMLDYGIILQLNSQELDIIQRIGRVIRIRLNHVGKIIIIIVMGTRDEEWLRSAIKNMSRFIVIKKYSEQEFFDMIQE